MQSNVTTYLKNYKPSSFSVSTVNLDFELHDDEVVVRNHMVLKREHPGDLHLFGDELELMSLEMNEKTMSPESYRIEKGDLIIPSCPDTLTLTVVTRIYPQKNTQLSGLYRSKNLFCTQCEAEGFRRITFFLDRPDVLATFTTRISADKKKYPVLLSNGNLIDSGPAEDGRHWVVWQDPFKKPAYLFALVAGDLAQVSDQFVTCSGRTIDLRIYVEPGNEDKCAHAMESLKKSMRWDEERYGREYDLDIFMIVAVSDFNMGAMENKGLNIFNSKYILARPDTATDQDYADIEGVVGHEYFHNWTGNRVTCRDWFQLSLKEGLTVFRDQEFSRDMGSRDVNRILDVKALRSTQFPEDAGSMAHPVRPESYQEINNFYTATVYNKGAEVIRMQHALLGDEGFRRGMDLYFHRHDGQAVTIDDFVAAMEHANDVDFTQFKHWYCQAGTPVIEVKTQFKEGRLTLSFSQSCPPTPECQEKKPFHIPIRVALFRKNGQAFPLERSVIELRESYQEVHFDGLDEQPVLSLLREFSAPVILRTSATEADWLALLLHETDGFAKWEASQNLALSILLQWYESKEHDWQLPPSLVNAYQKILLDESLDNGLRAELLTIPSFEDMAMHLNAIDVDKIEAVRDAFRKELGKKLFEVAHTLYNSLWRIEDHQMHAEAYGRRKLRNVCLGLMMRADEAKALPLCQQQFALAKTMTDQLASFALQVNSTHENARQKAIDDFYQQWKKDELVLDKWFSVQACCEQPGTLAKVKNLLSHPMFNIKNPNKVRSLLGAFVQSNPRNFHAIDGRGYEFLTEQLMALDKINPQVAARLATPFTRWQRLNQPRQTLIKQQLKRLEAESLSPDLRELVLKSLVES